MGNSLTVDRVPYIVYRCRVPLTVDRVPYIVYRCRVPSTVYRISCHVLKKVDSITTTFFLFFVTFFSFLVSTTVLYISFQNIDLLDNYAALCI